MCYYFQFLVVILQVVNPVVTTTYNPCTSANIAQGLIFFAYPNDNTKFIECNAQGQPQVLSCPSRLVYSPSRQSCLLPTGQTGGTGGTVISTGSGGGTVTGTVINTGTLSLVFNYCLSFPIHCHFSHKVKFNS